MTTTDPFTEAAHAAAREYARTPRMNVGTVQDRIGEAHADGWEAARTHLAAEVQAAKSEALRELSAHISEVVDNAKPWQVFTEHVLHEAGACDYLDRAATEYETGDRA